MFDADASIFPVGSRSATSVTGRYDGDARRRGGASLDRQSSGVSAHRRYEKAGRDRANFGLRTVFATSATRRDRR
jgi:hypothetical protein